MNMKKQRIVYLALGLLAAFLLWTAAVTQVDVQAIGPQGASVGFAALNRWVHALTGVHLSLYILTDWLSLVPLGLVAGFGCLGLRQWVQRKQLRKVDRSMLVLGGFYAVVLVIYLLFEQVVVNYRPVLIEGALESSYPSSTTMLVLCVMPTAMLQLNQRIGNEKRKRWVLRVLAAFTVFMVVVRLLSGVHWFTDIIGGILLSAGLVLLYVSAL